MRRVLRTGMAAAVLLGLAACSDPYNPGQRALGGGLLGAGGGAAVAGLTGGNAATGALLGAHYMGPQASTLIQQLITVMAFDLDLREVARHQYWIHPALPEVTENAILGLDLDFPEV